MWQLQRRLHGHCMATFCPSPSTRNMLHREGFDDVRLWPRGVDTSLFNPGRRSAALRASWGIGLPDHQSGEKLREKIVLSYVGRISHEKNIGLLIDAFVGLEAAARALDPSFPGCKLVLVGDGPARVELEKSCKDSDITFMGYRKGTELAECYASSDIFAFPSHSETFGNVVLEALASGLPVVGLHAEGVCDLVEHERTGKYWRVAEVARSAGLHSSRGTPSSVCRLLTGSGGTSGSRCCREVRRGAEQHATASQPGFTDFCDRRDAVSSAPPTPGHQ